METDTFTIETDDADQPDRRRSKLMLFRGGNGDLYLGTCSVQDRLPMRCVRIATSGGKLQNQNRSAFFSIVSLFHALEDPKPYRTDLIAKLDNLGATIRRLLAGQDTTKGKYRDAAMLLHDYGLFGSPLRQDQMLSPKQCTVEKDLLFALQTTRLHPVVYKAGRVLSFVYQGIHNVPPSQIRSLKAANETDYEPILVEVMVGDDLASFDFDRLTRLVFAAHEACVRVEISPANNRAVRVRFHNRSEDDLKMGRHHPRISTVIDALSARFPRPRLEPVEFDEGDFNQPAEIQNLWGEDFEDFVKDCVEDDDTV